MKRPMQVWFTCINCGALSVETQRDRSRYGWPKVCSSKRCKTAVKATEPLNTSGPEFQFEDQHHGE